jgi:outer membrane protein TolC
VLRETIKRQEQALEVMRLEKTAGQVTELAVQQFASQLGGTRALKSEFALRTTELENRIGLLIGEKPQGVLVTEQALDEGASPEVPHGVPSDLLRNRPDIREAELQLRAAACDVKAARAAFFPTITITGNVGLQAFNPRYLLLAPDSMVYSLAAGLVQPLVNRSAIRAEFDVASASQVQAMYQYQSKILTAFVEVSTSLAAVDKMKEIVAHRRTQRDALAETVAFADLLFKAGKATYFEVLSAQQNTLAAELDLIEARRAKRISSVLLYKSLGGGWR